MIGIIDRERKATTTLMSLSPLKAETLYHCGTSTLRACGRRDCFSPG